MAILNSNKELKNLFNRAVAGTWTPEKFTAELRNTTWFKKNGENARQLQLLKTTDPATYYHRVQEKRYAMLPIAVEMGANVPGSMMSRIAEQALSLGWNDQQIRSAMSQYIKQTGGTWMGNAQRYETELRDYAASMGVRVSEKTLQNWIKTTASGQSNIQTHMGTIQNLAETAFPQFQSRLQAGETMEDIASPYKQSMATLLELNPETLDLFDPTIRGALTARDVKTQKPTAKTLWEFENDLRKDKRWLKTSNAQDAASATVNRVLTDMGLIT